MAANGRIVTEDVTFRWDGASQRLARGTLIDVPAGSALEEAIGAARLAPLRGGHPAPVAEAAQQEETQPAAAKPKGAAKATDSRAGDDAGAKP